jgi:hypothetical protein
MKMPKRMAITKVLCCFIAIAVLMNAMPVSVFAVNSNTASNSVSNHSDSSVSLSSNVIYVPDAKDNRASPKQCNITAISSTGSAIFDSGEETYTYQCKGTDGHSEYVKIGNSTGKGIDSYFLGEEIIRREFEDTRGHLNNYCIPAIKLKEV